MDANHSGIVHLHMLGRTHITCQKGNEQKAICIQPKPLHLLAYLALNRDQPHRREELRALFWPDKPPLSAANNLRQALWHLRQELPGQTLLLQEDLVQWNPEEPPWVDVLAFESALNAGDLDTALDLYAGPLLPDAYDEWAVLERERLRLRYLTALETRALRHYETRNWRAAQADAETLLSADPLNEASTRLLMACHWALGQREAARRCYDSFRQILHHELQTDPLPETTDLYQRILRGEPHPDHSPPPADETVASRRAHFSLLEILGAFRQGLERATVWAAETEGRALAEARRWQGRFHMRLGQLAESRATLMAALPLANTPNLQAAVLADLACVEVSLGNYTSAEGYYYQALRQTPNRTRLLSSLGGLQGRMGRFPEAQRILQHAVHLARKQDDPADLAVASGNLGILLIGQGEKEPAEAALQEALNAARQADAHWLTAHLAGHLGVLAQDRDDPETAARHYQSARTLAEAISDQRSAVLWTLNLGIVYYEQGRWAEALQLLTEGQERASEQGYRSLEAGATIFLGACLTARGKMADGLNHIEQGLALALEVGDQERSLMGYLHKGRTLIAMDQPDQACAALQRGLRLAKASGNVRLGDLIRTELKKIPAPKDL